MPEPVARIAQDMQPISNRPSCAVLVMSCDAYSDLWRPFFNLFWKHWPDCPWPVYLGSNRAVFSDERVVTLAVGDAEWSGRLQLCLDRLSSDFVLLLLEDYFLDAPVSTPDLLDKFAALGSLGGAQLRLFPMPGPDQKLERVPGVGIIHPRAAYRVSTQAAFWDRKHLQQLVADRESIWDFEWNGSKRSRSFDVRYYATCEPAMHYRQVVERGEWFRGAAAHFGKQQIGCDFGARSVMSRPAAVKRAITTKLRNWRSRTFSAILKR